MVAGVLEAVDEVLVVVVEGAEDGCGVAGAAKRMPLDVMAPGTMLAVGLALPEVSRAVLESAARGSMGVAVIKGGEGHAGRDSMRFASDIGTERRENLPLNVTRAFSQVQDKFM